MLVKYVDVLDGAPVSLACKTVVQLVYTGGVPSG